MLKPSHAEGEGVGSSTVSEMPRRTKVSYRRDGVKGRAIREEAWVGAGLEPRGHRAHYAAGNECRAHGEPQGEATSLSKFEPGYPATG